MTWFQKIEWLAFILALVSLVLCGLLVSRYVEGIQTRRGIQIRAKDVTVQSGDGPPIVAKIEFSNAKGRTYRVESIFAELKLDDKTVGIRTPKDVSLDVPGSGSAVIEVNFELSWEFEEAEVLKGEATGQRNWMLKGEAVCVIPYRKESIQKDFEIERKVKTE